jgi:hypothetical protein
MADCTIDFQGVTYGTPELFRDALKTAKGKVNTNIHYRGQMSTKDIAIQDNLATFEPLPKGSSMKATERIKEAYGEGNVSGIINLRNKLDDSLEALGGIGKTTIGDEKIKKLRGKLKKDGEVYVSLLDKLNIPMDELADMAGVTEEEYEAYINREDLPKEVYDKINAFNKKHFTTEENDLFTAMRTIFKLVYPLSERVDKLLSPDGTYANIDEIVEDVKVTASAAKKRWVDALGNIPFVSKLPYIGGAITATASAIDKQIARFVTPDNLVMKMGFQKGSIGYDLLYYAMNKGNRDNGVDNAKVNTTLNDLAMSKGLNLMTSWRTGTNWKNIEKHKIMFAKGEVELTGDELISTYLTFRQDKVREQHMYDEERLLKEENEKKKIKTVNYKAFKSGDALSDKVIENRQEKKVILTPQAWEQIKREAEKPKYKDLMDAKRQIFEEQYQKVKDTLFILTGQSLPDIENYYPTFQHVVGKQSAYDRQKKMMDDIRYVKERENGIDDIAIGGFFSTVHNYAEATNYYHNTAIPINNANLLMSKLKKDEQFVKDWGLLLKQYDAWLEGLTDNKDYLNYTDSEKMINAISRAYYKGVLGWNVPVVLKQPIAAMHAANFFQNEKYGKAFYRAYSAALDPKDRLINEMKKYSPSIAPYVISNTIASPELGQQIRVGMDMSAGAVVTSGNFGAIEKAARQAGDLYLSNSMSLIKRFDLAGRAALFAASKEWVTDNYGLTEAKDGDAYWDAVAEIHAQSMEDTQQTWDFMHRSGFARSPNSLVRGIMMFSSQLQKHFSLLDKSYTAMVLYGRKEDYKSFVNHAISVLLVQSVMVAAIDMGRDFLLGYDDDDEDERFRTLAAKTFSNNMATLPIIGLASNDITNMLFNTDEYTKPISIPTLDLYREFQESISYTDKGEYNKLYTQIWRDYSKYMGIPLAPFKQIDSALKNME